MGRPTHIPPHVVLVALAGLLGACRDVAAPVESGASPALTAPSPALSISAFSGSGETALTGATLLDLRMADGNRLLTLSVTGTYTGTLIGTFTEEIHVTGHASGLETIHGSRTFTGVVGDRAGSCEMRIRGAGVVPSSFVGRWTITSCTGGLQGLHGEGTFELTAPATGPYSGRFHFGAVASNPI